MAQKKYGSIQHIYDSLAVLSVENKLFLVGQQVFVTVPGGRIGIKVGDGIKLFTALPWVVNPYRENPAAPFKVRNTDLNYQEIDNLGGGKDVKITDDRLIGRSDYIVTNNDGNFEFREKDLEYEADGVLIIKDFVLSDGSNISIFPNWQTDVSGGTQLILDQLQLVAEPFLVGGAILPWNKPISEIPAGWREVIDFKGKFIVGANEADPDFIFTAVGGSKTASLTAENNGPHDHEYNRNANGTYNGVNKDLAAGTNGSGKGDAKTTPSGEGKPFNILPPFKTCNFIEVDPDFEP